MKTQTQTNDLVNYRVEKLESNYRDLNDNINKLMTNHIPHLQEDIIRLKTQINIFTAVNVGAVILSIVIEKVLK